MTQGMSLDNIALADVPSMFQDEKNLMISTISPCTSADPHEKRFRSTIALGDNSDSPVVHKKQKVKKKHKQPDVPEPEDVFARFKEDSMRDYPDNKANLSIHLIQSLRMNPSFSKSLSEKLFIHNFRRYLGSAEFWDVIESNLTCMKKRVSNNEFKVIFTWK